MGETIAGTALFSNGRNKITVYIKFDEYIMLGEYKIMSSEFNLKTGYMHIWGQGIAEDIDDWKMDAKDCEKILKEGGG